MAAESEEIDAAVDTSCDPMMREVWRQRILETVQNYEMMHGLLPGDIAELRYIKDRHLEPRVMLYFTDGYGDAPKKAPAYSVIWVLTPDGKQPCGWGEVIRDYELTI